MTRGLAAVAIALVGLLSPPEVVAQSARAFEAAAQVTMARSGEFAGTDAGIGGRLAWHPIPLIGTEAEVDFYPGDYPDGVPFSRSRIEGLFGVTVGPRVGSFRPFARLRPGFVTFHEAPEPFACILIFPPPLQCALAAGETVFALDVGGGVEYFPAERFVIRVDVGDRVLRYSRPALDHSGGVRDDGSFSHGFRLSLGAGARF
jgi:hypothetical protein